MKKYQEEGRIIACVASAKGRGRGAGREKQKEGDWGGEKGGERLQ